MGKTSQKLNIWVHHAWSEHEKIKELEAKGHTIIRLSDDIEYDLILHPASHAWNDKMWDYLEIALKAARKRKYPAKRRKKDAD